MKKLSIFILLTVLVGTQMYSVEDEINPFTLDNQTDHLFDFNGNFISPVVFHYPQTQTSAFDFIDTLNKTYDNIFYPDIPLTTWLYFHYWTVQGDWNNWFFCFEFWF